MVSSSLHGILRIVRLISTARRTTKVTASSERIIKAETRKILADELLEPFRGGSLCELEDITGVGNNVIVG